MFSHLYEKFGVKSVLIHLRAEMEDSRLHLLGGIVKEYTIILSINEKQKMVRGQCVCVCVLLVGVMRAPDVAPEMTAAVSISARCPRT